MKVGNYVEVARNPKEPSVPNVSETLKSKGYAVIRSFLQPAQTAQIAGEVDKMYQEGLKHHATYRDKNLLFEILNHPKAQRRVVLQAHWTAWIRPLLERMRRSEEYFQVLGPLLGPDIKQISHQIHWKPPGAKYTFYRFHQDARFREGKLKNFYHLDSTVTTGLAIDRRLMINSYVRASDSERGGWAFRARVPTPLGAEPQLCKYDRLRERPGPFYIETDWTEEAKEAAAHANQELIS